MHYATLMSLFMTMASVGSYSKLVINHKINEIIWSNKEYRTLETSYIQCNFVFLILKLLSEGTFSHVVAHIFFTSLRL